MTATTDGIRGVEKLSAPIKFIWNYASNCLINQHAQVNRTHDILQDESKCEMIVTIDNHMTPTAKYSDILLPDCTTSEQMDFCLDAFVSNMAYVIFADQAVKPAFECKNIYDMMTGLAEKLGVKEKFTEGRTQEQWLRHLYEQSRANLPELPTFDQFRREGIFKKSIRTVSLLPIKISVKIQKNPLQTPSGKIEIYSSRLAEIAKTWKLAEGDVIDPLPIHVDSFEHYGDPLMEKYPLQLSGFHYKARTHSTYGNVDVLKQPIRKKCGLTRLMHRRAALKTVIVSVFLMIVVKFRLMQSHSENYSGVVALGEGAWYAPDNHRVDHSGCINVLTTQRPSPLAKGNPQHSNLVQVEKI